MAQNSKIEWTHHTLNLWSGCTKVHEGCDNCYAEKLSHRWGNDVWGNDKPRKLVKSAFAELNRFQKLAAAANETHRVFVGSMMDIFEKPVKMIDSKGDPYIVDGIHWTTGKMRQIFFSMVEMGKFPNLHFLLLTKRPSNINKYTPESWKENPPANVMFGISLSVEKNVADLFPYFIKVKGRKFLSIEPQIESIDLAEPTEKFGYPIHHINWIIQGGESGPGKRPFDLKWAYEMKELCEVANVPYFFKQIDKIQQIPDDLMIRQFPDAVAVI
ncbi:DUF5131 family protein [Flavobacterium sp.]|uniref:DUF5131 family protein n=1 Tax=Flavobacterium sp. TaxID=239 RepID=UPI00121B22E6|nr:DUF5131 family protein [Flavobacterium sp.]RZJ71100.1 MAG: DUF5131 family protein [Flavobacterium sp.]